MPQEFGFYGIVSDPLVGDTSALPRFGRGWRRSSSQPTSRWIRDVYFPLIGQENHG